MDWLREDWQDLLVLTEDWMRSKEFEMFGYCSNSILAVGDPVKVTGPECTGQVGELAVIDPENDPDGDIPFGVYLDSVECLVWFGIGDVERAGV